jgi:hypothetical protein
VRIVVGLEIPIDWESPWATRQTVSASLGEETPLVHGKRLGSWLVYWIVTSLDGELNVLEDRPGAAIEIRLPSAS